MRRWHTLRLPILAAMVLVAVGALALARAAGGSAPPAFVSAAVPAPADAADTPVTSVAAPAVAPPLDFWGPPPALASPLAPPAVGADAAVVLDEASGSVLYEKSAHLRIAPASLTKIMTALIALERGDLRDTVAVNVDGRRMGRSTVMGLVPGERLSLEDLLYGLLLPSGNDAALAIAEHIGGSAEGFVAIMNARAAALGLADTHFANPHGLDAAGHYSSAYDLALLTRLAMQRADFRRIVNTGVYVAHGALHDYAMGSLNPLYGRIAGVDGVKTGYTRNARQAIVGSVSRDDHRVFVVVLRAGDRVSDSVALLNWTFTAYTWPAAPSAVAADTAAVGS